MAIPRKPTEKRNEPETDQNRRPEVVTSRASDPSPQEKLANVLGKLPKYAKQKLLAGGVTRQDVVWCYRHLLGREPESERVVEAGTHTPDFKKLVLGFISSQEFIAKHASVNLAGFGWGLCLPHVLDELAIDIDATPAELAQCAAKIKDTWQHLGGEKAHFSVLTDDSFLPQNLHTSIDAFWASGESETAQAIVALSQFGAAPLEQKVCVEYGCGVGRVTVNLAKSFEFVHAYDISRNHLDYARARARELGAGNIAFHECAHDFRVALEPCDFFYSIIVLQHNPPPVILELIRIALGALKPGGIAIFQVPTYIVGYRFALREWLAAEHGFDMQMHCVPQRAVLEIISAANCQLLSVREDGWSSAKDGIVSNTFFCRKQ